MSELNEKQVEALRSDLLKWRDLAPATTNILCDLALKAIERRKEGEPTPLETKLYEALITVKETLKNMPCKCVDIGDGQGTVDPCMPCWLYEKMNPALISYEEKYK